MLYIGRGSSFPIALEGALKLKEISYIHAEGYAGGEMKHGPIALIDEAVPVVVVAPTDAIFDKIASNFEQVKARGGKLVLLSDAGGQRPAGRGMPRRRSACPRSIRWSRRSSTPCRCSCWPTTRRSPRAPTSTSRAISPRA